MIFSEKPRCVECNNDIQENDVVHVKLRYPKRKGITEIKAYLQNEGEFTCTSCHRKKSSE